MLFVKQQQIPLIKDFLCALKDSVMYAVNLKCIFLGRICWMDCIIEDSKYDGGGGCSAAHLM